MSIIGKIQSLFSDREKTQPIFPITKTKAVSDDNGVGLDVLLADKASTHVSYYEASDDTAIDSVIANVLSTLDIFERKHIVLAVTGIYAKLFSDNWYITLERVVTLYHITAKNSTRTVKRCYDGSIYKFSEWMWENPPMKAGEEYCTTELFNGKVVYAKLIDFGTMPNKTNKYTDAGTVPVGAKNVQFYGFAYEESSGEHFALNYPGVKCWVNTSHGAGYIGMYTDADWTTCTAYFIVKYTKD